MLVLSRVVLVNTARPDGAFLFVVWFIHWKRMIWPFLFRGRPFNLQGGYGFLFLSEFVFRTTQELEYLFFFVAQSAIFFLRIQHKVIWQKSDYYFFSSTEIRIFFFSNIGNPNIFLEKNHKQERIIRFHEWTNGKTKSFIRTDSILIIYQWVELFRMISQIYS